MVNWFLDFEAYQIGKDYYPVEICLVNGLTKRWNLFYVRYNFSYNTSTTHYQFKKHGIRWDDGNVSLNTALNAILRRVKRRDVIYVKGEQKRVFLQNFIWFDRRIEEIVCASRMRDLVEMYEDETCWKHSGLTKHHRHNLSCARHKCFALASFFDNVFD